MTSKIDSENRRFIRLYQQKHGLEADGIAGKKTFATLGEPLLPAIAEPATKLSMRGLLELVGHESIVREAYRDSEGVWTWGIGVTDYSGHSIGRYKDNPSSLEKCVEIFLWLVNRKYLPAVLEAFEGTPLSEAQLAAAVSFHYNTGAIGRATWVKLWKAGKVADARESFMEWRIPSNIVERRKKECALFFDGIWSSDGTTLDIPVAKPSYQPVYSKAQKVDIRPIIERMGL